MRPGNWPDRDVRHFDVVARFNGGPPVQVESMRLSHSMIDGHPSGLGGGMSTSGTITILTDAVATSITHDPWSRRGDFPPKSGTPVTIDITDGEGQSWRRLTGITERASGAFSKREVVIPVRDAVDKLGAIVSSEAMLDIHPPLFDGGDWRRPRACAEWLLDRAARAAGWYATPQMRSEAIFSAPMVGSAWPERGTLVSSTNVDDNGGPVGAWTTQWHGLKDISAIWDMTGYTRVAELTTALLSQASGESMRVQVYGNNGAGAYVLTDSGSNIRFGTVNGGTLTELGTLAKGSATRVSLRATGTSLGVMTVTVRTDTGAQASGTQTNTAFESLPFTKVRVYGRGNLGWVQVLDYPATQWMLLDRVGAATTARILTGETPERWDAAPQVWDTTVIDLIADWARATCGQAWIDMDGNLQLASRGVLDAAPPVAVDLWSDTSLLDVEWEDDGMHVARQVFVKHQHPKIQRSKFASWRVWQGRSQTLGPGEEDVVTVEIPDNEDWIDLDSTPHQVTTATTRTDILRNTVVGGMQVSDTDDSTNVPALFVDTSMTADGPRAWEVRVEPWESMAAGQYVVTMIPEEMTTIPRRYRGLPLPDVKARARVYRLERAQTIDTIPGDGATVQLYEHDAGWWIQDLNRRSQLHTFLRYQMGVQQPTPTRVPIAPDPRIELGDTVALKDSHRTGVRVGMLVTQIDEDFSAGSGLSMDLSGRAITWSLPPELTPTDVGHEPAWTLEDS